MKFTLPDLPYEYDALEPHIDATTMRIHHDKHHAAYVQKLNEALADLTEAENLSIEQLMASVSLYSKQVRDNGGGHYNHSLFWNIMTPDGSDSPRSDSSIQQAVEESFGSFDGFKEKFKKAALERFGSGWAWLCADLVTSELFIISTPNQDNPLMDVAERRGTPLLGLDVWEHAYYLNWQNRRPDYVDAFFHVINWDEVNENYEAVRSLELMA